jgi:hypothetical protein
MITLCALAITLPVALALPPTHASQDLKARADADLKELSTYALSMDTLNKIDRAMRTFAVEIKKDPKFQEASKLEAEMKALEKKFQDTEPTDAEQKRIETIEARLEALEGEGSLNMSDAQTISDMAAKIQKQPAMAAALQREGLSARDYAKFMMAMLQAGLAAGMQKAGLLKELPAGTNPANVKWIVEHEAELKKLQESWGSLMK